MSNQKEIRNKKIIELYNSGLSLREVGERVNLTKQQILNILNKNNIKTQSSKEAILNSKKEDDQKIINLYKKGYSKTQICNKLSISYQRINSAFKRMKIKYIPPDYFVRDDEKLKKIKTYALNNPNKTQEEIAKIFNISQQTVSKILSNLPCGHNKTMIQKRIKEYNNESVKELANKYNIHYAAALKFIKKYINNQQ